MSILVRASGLCLPGRLQPTELALEAGSITGVIGANGSGKTSLLHALAGIGRPAGEVRIGDANPAREPPERRMHLLSFLPASRDVAWPLLVSDFVALGLPAGADPARLERVLALLALGDLAARRMDRISTGERSRAMIARALAAEPQLLALDEPVSNLDPAWQLRLVGLLRSEARQRGCAVVMTLHDLALARYETDRLLVMESGRIAADGDPCELFGSGTIERSFDIRWEEGRWRAAEGPRGND
jgi:iron complex transport system ATP-binding protein